MAILQLNPSIPLDTPKGRGEAILVTDYSPEHDHMWTVIIDDTCEVWTFKNSEVRGVPNQTLGRGKRDALTSHETATVEERIRRSDKAIKETQRPEDTQKENQGKSSRI